MTAGTQHVGRYTVTYKDNSIADSLLSVRPVKLIFFGPINKHLIKEAERILKGKLKRVLG